MKIINIKKYCKIIKLFIMLIFGINLEIKNFVLNF